jgi:cellobiose phosphorylase
MAVAGTEATSGAPAAEDVAQPLGRWLDDEHGLPCYRYLGPLAFHVPMKNGQPAKLPDDPFFLLGNYRLTLFVHASGRYQLITGERAWGRMNRGDAPATGANEAAVVVVGQRHELIGMTQPAAADADKLFGVGFARYVYHLEPSVTVTRTISVLPSARPGDGSSAFLVAVRLRNTGASALKLSYSESVRANYEPILAPWAPERRLVKYTQEVARDDASAIIRADVHARGARPLSFAPAGQMSRLDGAPPALFLKAARVTDARAPLRLSADKDASGHDRLELRCDLEVAANADKEITFVVGYSHDPASGAIEALASRLLGRAAPSAEGGCFGKAWQRTIPEFADEPDVELRRELRWDVAVLEQMATWREYYDETVVPQGTEYDYMWGLMASNRDLAQHALPLCHTNPALARSVLRFIMKRIVPDGEVKLNDEGYGWSAHGPMLTSDQQLYFFMLLAEYLRVTGDTTILSEEIGYYPVECGAKGTGLDHVRRAFLFLRERIATGSHGLVRLWNSDWNDMFYWWPNDVAYNVMFSDAESHMNSAMAVAILGDLASVLPPGELAGAVRGYRGELLDAYLRDLGTRAFPRRAYIRGNQAYGEAEMWLEPQGFTLLIPELDQERKRRLFGEVRQRLLAGEALGPRQIEKPVQHGGTEPGSRENGGFWYALTGPLILGVATFDREAAAELLKKMTFANYARHFPHYWTGQWAASDSLDSSLLPSEGLSGNLVYCAHPHAWPLYCYLRLKGSPPVARRPLPIAAERG